MDGALVRALRARGADVTIALDERMIERSDAEHLDFASSQERVLFSFNCSQQYATQVGRTRTSAEKSGGSDQIRVIRGLNMNEQIC